jgi:hypothetical protein
MEARIYKTTNLYLFLFIGNICDQDSLDIPLLARCKVNNDATPLKPCSEVLVLLSSL